MLELMRWLGDFAYYNICHIFGMRVREGQSTDVRMLLSRYCRSGKLEKIGRGVYRKVKG